MSNNSLSDSQLDSKIEQHKPVNFVIMWYGQVWRWFEKILNTTNAHIYVISKSSGEKDPHDNIYSTFKELPIEPKDIDAVLFCWTNYDLLQDGGTIPYPAKEKVVTIQNGFTVFETKRELWIKNNNHIVLFSALKENNWEIIISTTKPNPVMWPIARSLAKLLNMPSPTIPSPYINFLSDELPSWEVRKEWIKKGILNSTLNIVCLAYSGGQAEDGTVWKSLEKYGHAKFKLLVKEMHEVLCAWESNKNQCPSLEETRDIIEKTIHQYSEMIPSSVYDFYQKVRSDRNERMQKDNFTYRREYENLIKAVIAIGKQLGLHTPLASELLEQIESLKKELK